MCPQARMFAQMRPKLCTRMISTWLKSQTYKDRFHFKVWWIHSLCRHIKKSCNIPPSQRLWNENDPFTECTVPFGPDINMYASVSWHVSVGQIHEHGQMTSWVQRLLWMNQCFSCHSQCSHPSTNHAFDDWLMSSGTASCQLMTQKDAGTGWNSLQQSLLNPGLFFVLLLYA